MKPRPTQVEMVGNGDADHLAQSAMERPWKIVNQPCPRVGIIWDEAVRDLVDSPARWLQNPAFLGKVRVDHIVVYMFQNLLAEHDIDAAIS